MEEISFKKKIEEYNEKLKKIVEKEKLNDLESTIENMQKEMNKEGFWDDHQKASLFTKKYKNIKNIYDEYNNLKKDLEELIFFSEEYEQDLQAAVQDFEEEFQKFEIKILLKAKYDNNNCILEIHPGAGGVESHDFAQMLLNMYQKYFKDNNFDVTILDYNKGDVAGVKSVSLEIKKDQAYGLLKGESGVHRLIRISPFDSGKRRHTSFASVKISPEIEKEEFDILDKDLKIDVYRSSGAGGQSVNTTDSAVRITHIPTGIIVTCQNERSQLQNKEQALKILRSKLSVIKEEEYDKETKKEQGQIKNNGFGSQKRTYTLHPYKLVKDHITGYEVHDAERVLGGDIGDFLYHNLLITNKK